MPEGLFQGQIAGICRCRHFRELAMVSRCAKSAAGCAMWVLCFKLVAWFPRVSSSLGPAEYDVSLCNCAGLIPSTFSRGRRRPCLRAVGVGLPIEARFDRASITVNNSSIDNTVICATAFVCGLLFGYLDVARGVFVYEGDIRKARPLQTCGVRSVSWCSPIT